MRFTKYLQVTCFTAVALVAGGQAFARSSQEAALATPLGITIQETRVNAMSTFARGMGAFGGPIIPGFADAHGMSVYTYEKDQPGKFACVDACLEKWHPTLAPAKAAATGAWTLVARGKDKQWAFGGKPVYTFAEDTKIGEVKGNGQEDGAWKVAAPDPVAGVQVPDGLAVQDVADANGLTLINVDKMTMYTFDGDVKKEKSGCFDHVACTFRWSPVVAPRLAHAVGNFSVLNRPDGVRQWAFQGKALYTYGGDIEINDVNGNGIDKSLSAAVVQRYFVPDTIKMFTTPGQGVTWTTADGLTVYRRSIYTFQQGGHGLRRGAPINPAMGRALGTYCNEQCQKQWRPVLASGDAVSSGYWEVIDTMDGKKQWAYKGYPLFQNVNDKKPGDLAGIDVFDLSFEEPASKVADSGAAKSDSTPPAPPRVTPPFYWSIAYP